MSFRIIPRSWMPCFLISGLLVSLIIFQPGAASAENESFGPVDLRTAITDVVKKNIDAVVHIEVSQRQRFVQPMLPFQNDPFFRFFFDFPRRQRSFEREQKGLGSGMIVDSEGHILTNNHVVAAADEIKVLLSDGRTFPAEMKGSDPKTDLAVIKIAGDGKFPCVSFGDSDRVEVGEWVVAIGHPRGLDQTVTHGIISAKHRRGITDPRSYQDFLQTDAAINPGNSGGPLMNLHGQVIGVNAAIVSQSGGFEGIGFAIPSNMAMNIANALIAHGSVERGWLGIDLQDLTPDLARSFGLESTRGALISGVKKGGPAEKAGLRRGDVITAFDGKQIQDSLALKNQAAITPVGNSVDLEVVRKGRKLSLVVNLESRKDADGVDMVSAREILGVVVRAVKKAEARRYRIKQGMGVAIEQLEPSGPLGRVGFEEGDFVLELNGEPLHGVEDFIEKIRHLEPNQRITVLALDHRRGKTGYVQVVVR